MVSCAAGFSEPSGSLKPSCSGGSHLRPFDRTPSTAPSPIGSDRNGTGSSRRRAPQSTWAHVHSLATHPRRFPHACRLLTLAPSRAAGLAGASLARALAVCAVSSASIAPAHSSPSARRCSRPPVRWRPAACSCGGGEAAPALAAGCGVVGRVHAGSGRHLRARERPASMASARGCPRPPPPWCFAPLRSAACKRSHESPHSSPLCFLRLRLVGLASTRSLHCQVPVGSTAPLLVDRSQDRVLPRPARRAHAHTARSHMAYAQLNVSRCHRAYVLSS